MSWVRITNGADHSTDSNGFTSKTFDTTGADFIDLFLVTDSTAGASPISDNKSNAWHTLTEWTGIFSDRVCRHIYAENATTGSGHTFTVAGTSIFPTFLMSAYSGGPLSAAFDVENGSSGVFGTSVQTGLATPGGANELFLAGLQYDDNSTAAVDSGFTITDQVIQTGFGYQGGALADLIETAATAKNVTFNWTGNSRGIGAIAVFKSGGAADVLMPQIWL